jgi:hypothetical protein
MSQIKVAIGQGEINCLGYQALLKVLLPQLGTRMNIMIKGSCCMALENVVVKNRRWIAWD